MIEKNAKIMIIKHFEIFFDFLRLIEITAICNCFGENLRRKHYPEIQTKTTSAHILYSQHLSVTASTFAFEYFIVV